MKSHGETRMEGGRQIVSSEYQAWCQMRKRCLNPKHKAFPRYGGRGITICRTWDSFETFLADMGRKPTPKHTLDRIDNDGPYSKTNCRWATYDEQNKNRSCCKAKSWVVAEILGVAVGTARTMMQKVRYKDRGVAHLATLSPAREARTRAAMKQAGVER